MPVTFVLRSHYFGPTDKHIVRFDDDSVLDWFRARWTTLRGDEDTADDNAEAILGARVYGFGSLGRAIVEHDLAPPDTMEALDGLLQEHLYVEGEIVCAPHCLQVLTDDDEVQLAYFFFDDHFEAPERAAFLLHDRWQLPTEITVDAPSFEASVPGTALEPRGEGEGTTWACLVCHYDSESIDGNEPHVLHGARLPDLLHWLTTHAPSNEWAYPIELRILRAELLVAPNDADDAERAFLTRLRASPADSATWAVYSDWLRDRGRPSVEEVLLARALRAASAYPMMQIGGDSWKDRCLGDLTAAHEDAMALRGSGADTSRSPIAVSPHVAQLCLFVDEWSPGQPQFHQWIFFDDVWAKSHPALANALLRWTARWDILS